jgi:hypothetical protein
MYLRGKRVIFGFSTNDNLFAIFIGWPIEEFRSVKADIEGQFMRVVHLVPGFAERVRCGRREERFYGSADVGSFLRRPIGPGWALVGDAGCHKDPFMALGICDAFRDADFLVAAVHEGLAGENSLDEALIRYKLRRNEATMADYRENIDRAKFVPMPAEALQLRAALRGNQDETRRFIMASEGMIPPKEFFNPRTWSGFWSTPKPGQVPRNAQVFYLSLISFVRPPTMFEQEPNRLLPDAPLHPELLGQAEYQLRLAKERTG